MEQTRVLENPLHGLHKEDSGADAESCHDELVQGAPEDAVRHRKTSDEDDSQKPAKYPLRTVGSAPLG